LVDAKRNLKILADVKSSEKSSSHLHHQKLVIFLPTIPETPYNHKKTTKISTNFSKLLFTFSYFYLLPFDQVLIETPRSVGEVALSNRIIEQHVSAASRENRLAIETNEVELTFFGMRQEDDVVFCVFWAFDFADGRERVRWFTFGFFFANAPVVVGVPVKCFPAVELNRCAIMADEIPWKMVKLENIKEMESFSYFWQSS
jgi:hypothetical protein